MISEAQNKEIHHYLKLLEAREMEVYNEFYDHIVTGYEERLAQEPSLKIKQYLQYEFLPAFGGTTGIKKIICKRNKETQKFYINQLKQNFASYFQWPMMLIVIALYLIIWQCFALFEPKPVFLWGSMLLSVIPILIVFGGYVGFYVQCKMRKLPYVSSIKNKSIIVPVIFISWIAQFPNWLKIVNGGEIIWSDSPLVILLLSIMLTFISIFSMSYIKLLKQHFDFKFRLA